MIELVNIKLTGGIVHAYVIPHDGPKSVCFNIQVDVEKEKGSNMPEKVTIVWY